MKKIKPVVKGYVKVKCNGAKSCVEWGRRELAYASKSGTHVHSNGKSKFRPVYDYGVSHDQN